MYSIFQKIFKISQFALYQFGEKITRDQLETSILAIMQTDDFRTINKYVELATKDFSPSMTAQFKKEDDFYVPQPNKPKTANELIGLAFKNHMKNADLDALGKKAKEHSED